MASFTEKHKYYVVTGQFDDGTGIYLHKFILNIEIPKGYEIDHINCNSLDNRKSNLRVVTRLQNIQNVSVRDDSQSGIRGVNACRQENSHSLKYRCNFIFNKIRFYFKDWNSIEEAVYCRYCIEKHFHLHILDRNPLFEKYNTLTEERKLRIKLYVNSIVEKVLESYESNGT